MDCDAEERIDHNDAGYNNEETTARGAEFVYAGMNPADALSRFVADSDVMREIRNATKGELTGLTAFDDEMTASVYPLEDGTFELHLYVNDTDTAITLPATANIATAAEMGIDLNEWISVPEAAEILGVHRNRVLQLVKDELLEAHKVGQRWNIKRSSVEDRAANPPKAGRRW